MTVARAHPGSLLVSRTYLAHAVLAHKSSEVQTLDEIIALKSKIATSDVSPGRTTLFTLPSELLLSIRGFLLPAVTESLLAATTRAYASALLAHPRRLCDTCLHNTVEKYGYDAFEWPPEKLTLNCWNLGDKTELREYNCSCTSCAQQANWGNGRADGWKQWVEAEGDQTAPANETLGRTTSSPHDACTCPQPNRTPRAWLDAHLSTLTPHAEPITGLLMSVLATDFQCICAPSHTEMLVVVPAARGAFMPADVGLWLDPLLPHDPAEKLRRVARVERALALPRFSTLASTGSEIVSGAREIAAGYVRARVRALEGAN
ncbi:hypothetical protein BV25DRAFT_510475 [Artomyces pyxidatus]|uniref:Uncharacterized protein n=1 Tax=Artomyces pyxidatus TaxID=48021 RepID=A0ACB8TI25_9AGAM|nr:hypothetical protein BV25DRAFT_510475 [Artomyces pyxidatus]